MLVVDDSATMRRIIINTLQRIGYDACVEAADGSEALERFDSSIGCVLTDWNMPGMSGLDFVRSLRTWPDGDAVKIIMVTTRSVREDILQAAQAGVNNYVVKPTAEVLKEKLDRVFATQGVSHEPARPIRPRAAAAGLGGKPAYGRPAGARARDRHIRC